MTRSPHPDAADQLRYWRAVALYLGAEAIALAVVIAVLWSLR
jgi:hypothetical protein